MVENTTIRSYRCVCDSQMQRPGVVILLFEKKQTRVWEDECVRAPILRVQLYVGGIDLGSSDGACEMSREIGVMCLKKRLVYSPPRGYSYRTPSIRYVSDGANFCTYTAVEKELVPWHMLHHGRENMPTLRHPGIVPHFETRTVNKFWACLVTFQITTTTTLYLIANLFTPITT